MVEYKNTKPHARTLDQHTQCLLDLYKEICDRADTIAVKKTSQREIDSTDKKLRHKMRVFYQYMFNHFPKPADKDSSEWTKHLNACSTHVFGLTADNKKFSSTYKYESSFEVNDEISGTALMWEVPPETLYEILPIVLIRDGLKYRSIPLGTVPEFKGDFVKIYGDIVLSA